VRGRRKEKSETERREKNKKQLDLRKRVKKSKNNTKKANLESTWKKKKGDQTKGIEFPHFSNTLKLHALHTHTQQKNTLNHVPIYASYWQSAFFFSFSFRFAS